MRNITISTDVFAEIWKRHSPGESNEDDILRKVLDLPSNSGVNIPAHQPLAAPTGGYVDDRYGVQLPEGFEIFRIYKGREFRAQATQGTWRLLNDNTKHQSLNKLSWAVVQGHENAWHNWKYKDEQGRENFLHALRDQTKVATRT